MCAMNYEHKIICAGEGSKLGPQLHTKQVHISFEFS